MLHENSYGHATEAFLYSQRAKCEFYLKKYTFALEDIEYAISLDPKVSISYISFFGQSTEKLDQFTNAKSFIHFLRTV